jgi:hypothetical protein
MTLKIQHQMQDERLNNSQEVQETKWLIRVPEFLATPIMVWSNRDHLTRAPLTTNSQMLTGHKLISGKAYQKLISKFWGWWEQEAIVLIFYQLSDAEHPSPTWESPLYIQKSQTWLCPDLTWNILMWLHRETPQNVKCNWKKQERCFPWLELRCSCRTNDDMKGE